MALTGAVGDATHSNEPPSRRVSQILLGRFTRVLAAVVVAAAFVIPGDGYGSVATCYFKGLFQLPCPGCGLSRSLTSITHLQFGDAVAYHPFGLLMFPLLCAILAVSLSPARCRAAVVSWLDARTARVRKVYLTGVATFLAFGVGRLVLSGLANGWPSLGG